MNMTADESKGRYTVYLDGARVGGRCVAADDDEGWCDLFDLPIRFDPAIGAIPVRRHYGNVSIVERPAREWPAIAR